MTKKNDKAKGAVVQGAPAPGLPLSGEGVGCAETPLSDLLRRVPKDLIARWDIPEEGRELWQLGSASAPVGALCHRAADQLDASLPTAKPAPEAGWLAEAVSHAQAEIDKNPERCDAIRKNLGLTTPPSAGPDAGLGRDVLEIAVATVRWALARGDDLRDYKEPLEVILSAADPLPAAAALEAAAERERELREQLIAKIDLHTVCLKRIAEMRKALERIQGMCPATCETSAAHDMAQIATEALQQADSAHEAEGV